eukprot:9574488-Lingulodinium_polyedra.AAC.1
MRSIACQFAWSAHEMQRQQFCGIRTVYYDNICAIVNCQTRHGSMNACSSEQQVAASMRARNAQKWQV